jgi:FixJ family two-component response regulator
MVMATIILKKPLPQQGSPARDGRPAVCIVDDDASLLRALQRLISAAGFIVEIFQSGEAFLDSDRRAACGCLVLDVHLGGLSGFELHERLVAEGLLIPVIFITGHDDSFTRERARTAGAVAYLRKPFDDHLLIDAIRRVI